MKCHILFSEKNKKNISKCRLLKILPRVLSVKATYQKGVRWTGSYVSIPQLINRNFNTTARKIFIRGETESINGSGVGGGV